ncbi:MAG: Holliday junction resolvase RuvX [Clostridiaceae bacterium]
MRILGLDIGTKTVGVAVSDPLGFTAQGITTVARKNYNYDIAEIKKLYDEYQAEIIVVGLPKNMNGTLGEAAERTYKFCEKLTASFNPRIEYWDERLTTTAAHRAMLEADLSRNKRKKIVDKIAAALILQGYLDKNSK